MDTDRTNPYGDILQQKYGEWSVMSGKSQHTQYWTAWAVKGALTTRDPLKEPGEVYFSFGPTRQEAIKNLIITDLSNPYAALNI